MSGAFVEVAFEVERPLDGLRVDSYLASRLRRYSRTQVRRLIEAGRVTLRGRKAKPSSRVSDGETVVILYPRRQEPPPAHQALAVLYEDDRLLAVNKPGDLLSHPTDRVVENTATSVLKTQFPDLRLHLVHRLDRETSGALLLAKDPKTARALTDLFAQRKVRKEYLAIVRGRVPWRRRTVDMPIGREGLEIKVRQAAGIGQPALTEFERVGSGTESSWVRALPRTGRLHQIRVHLAHLGHPVLGDKLYLGAGEFYMKAVRRELAPEDLEGLGAPRQMLHASRLSFEDPATREPVTIEAPPPGDFEECLARAGLTGGRDG